MRVAMSGTGYVGLVSGACFADFGHHVTCVDRNAKKIAMLAHGESPIYEPGLDALVERNRREGRLSFTSEFVPAGRNAEVICIAVGTPSRRGEDMPIFHTSTARREKSHRASHRQLSS